MTTQVFIRLPDHDEHIAEWVELGPDNALLASGQFQWPDELAEFALNVKEKDLHLLLPTAKVLLTDVQVPEKQQKHIDKVLPYLMEDSIAGNVDDLHFIVAEKVADNRVLAVAVNHDTMENLLQQCAQNGLNPLSVRVDALGLNYAENQLTLLVDSKRATLRQSNGQAVQFERNGFAELLPLLRADKSLHVISADAEFAIEDPESREEVDHALAYLARQLIHSNVNLRQGQYAPASEWKAHWLTWKPLVKAFAVAALFAYALVLGDLALMKYRMNQLDNEIRQSYAQAFPNEAEVALPIVSMRGYMKKFADGGTGNTLTSFLAEVAPILADTDDLVVRSAGYEASSQALRVDLTAPDLSTLNMLVQRFQQMGYNTDMGQASSSGDGYSSRLELRRAGGKVAGAKN